MEYSEEQLNYFRLCYVGFDLVPEGLRQIFKNEWDFRYKAPSFGEWKDTAKNGHDFYNNESKKSRKKNARYLTTIRSGNTAAWDSSCLFFAILYSDSVGTTLSPAVQREVDDIRQVRNEIAHITEAKLTDADFQTSVDRVLNSFTSLGLATTEIQGIKNQKTFPTKEVENFKKQARDLQAELDQTKCDLKETKSALQSTEADLVSAKEQNKALTQEISAKLQPFCFLASTPPHDIIRRSHDIERITKKMEELSSGANGGVSTVYLSGNPGCGKSQIAREIGQQFFSEWKGDAENLIFVATLNAETIDTLADSYMTLGRYLGITEYALSRLESLKIEKPLEAVQQLHRLILPKVTKFTKWMIIADNVVDLRSVRGLLPQTGSKEWGHGQVVITTQDSTTISHNAPHTYHESLSKGMRLDEAVELLEKVSQISDREQAENVAELLDFQPLALAAAAFYVQTVISTGSSNYEWKAYLRDISTYGQRYEIETILANESLAYSKTTMAAVKMAIERAVDTDKVFRHTFSFLSLCAHDDIPLEVVSNFVKAQTKDQPEELIKAKIVKSSLVLEGDERRYIRLHKIVYEALIRGEVIKLTSEEINCNLAEAIKIFKSLLEENEADYGIFRTLRRHSESLIKHITPNCSSDQLRTFLRTSTPSVDLNMVADWLRSLASICCDFCDLLFAKTVVDLACDLLKDIEETDPGVVLKGDILDTSGRVYDRIGKYSQAEGFHKKALMSRKKIFGEDHTDVASSYNNLASVYSSLGEYNQAKDLHEKALLIWKKINGEDHFDVATSYNNLASVYTSLGEYDQAKDLLEKALVIWKIKGEDYVHVATSYNNLATVYHGQGKYNKAKELYENALMIKKKIFGEDHADIALSYFNLASVHSQRGEYNQAKKLHEKALMIREKIFGEDHADIASSYNSLGLVYNDLGEYDQAKELNEKALVIWKKIKGEDHVGVATSYNNLAKVYCRLGKYNEAKKREEKALMIRKKILGEDHVDTGSNYNSLASVYYHLGEYDRAKELNYRALAISTKINGEDHVDVAASYNSLAAVYLSLGEYEQAKELSHKALVIWKKVNGEEHVDVAKGYNSLAVVYSSLGEYNKAKSFGKKALMIRKKIFGEEHADVQSSYNSLASVYNSLGEYNQAKELLEKALVISRKINGEDHVAVAFSCNNLATVYNSLGKYEQAKELCEKALVIWKKIKGEDYAHVATTYNNLATVYHSLGKYNEAKELYEKALMIKKKVFGEDHPDTASSYNNLAALHSSLGEYIQAKELIEKALMIKKKIFGEDHPDTASIYNNLAAVYSSLGKYNQAKELREKALVIWKKIQSSQRT